MSSPSLSELDSVCGSSLLSPNLDFRSSILSLKFLICETSILVRGTGSLTPALI